MFWDLFWSCSCDILRKGEFTKLTCSVSERLETQVPLDLANSSVADLSDRMYGCVGLPGQAAVGGDPEVVWSLPGSWLGS